MIGGSGMVASRLVNLLRNKYEIISADEKTLDITNKEAVLSFFDNNSFDAVVNFAAYTNVDGAEAEKGDERGLVWRLNVDGPKYLTNSCMAKNIFLVHISTDFVFPGNEKSSGPYSEDQKLPENSDGIGWYGWTKNRAEKAVLESGCKNAIIRYGYPFRADNFEPKKDWARNLINLYNEQKLYPLFSDQVQNVVLIDDLATPLDKIIAARQSGIFHLVSKDTTTPYEIGSYLLEKYSGSQVKVEKGSMEEFLKNSGRTPRPRLGGLKVETTEEVLDIKMPTWRQMVDDFIDQIKKEN